MVTTRNMNDRHQHDESINNHIDQIQIFMELQREIETLKRKNTKEINVHWSKNARLWQNLKRSGTIPLQAEIKHNNPIGLNAPSVPKTWEANNPHDAHTTKKFDFNGIYYMGL